MKKKKHTCLKVSWYRTVNLKRPVLFHILRTGVLSHFCHNVNKVRYLNAMNDWALVYGLQYC